MDLLAEVSKVAKSRASQVDDDGMNDPANDQKLAPEDDMPDAGIPKETQQDPKEDVAPPEKPDDLASLYDFDEEDFVEDPEPTTQGKKDEADGKTPASENAGGDAEDQIARAIAMGLKPEEVREFSQLGNLGKILDALEKRKGTSSPEASDPNQKQDSGASSTDDSLGIDDFKIELDENYFDPELTDELNDQIKTKLGPVIKRLNENVSTMRSQLENERRIAFERDFDGLIEALDDSYEDLLGKQPGRSLDPNSKQMQNRIQVLQKMATLGQTQQGADMPELFSQALALVFKDQMKQIAAHELRNSLKKRQGQLMSRPEHRKRNLPPRQKAVQSVAKFLTDEGYNPVEEAFDEEEFS